MDQAGRHSGTENSSGNSFLYTNHPKEGPSYRISLVSLQIHQNDDNTIPPKSSSLNPTPSSPESSHSREDQTSNETPTGDDTAVSTPSPSPVTTNIQPSLETTPEPTPTMNPTQEPRQAQLRRSTRVTKPPDRLM